MGWFASFISACWADGHDWTPVGSYLVCKQCGKVKKQYEMTWICKNCDAMAAMEKYVPKVCILCGGLLIPYIKEQIKE